MAFTTITGINGFTTLSGTDGVDVATIVNLNSNVFIGAQPGDDKITVDVASGNNVITNYTVNGGSGGDTILILDAVLNSSIFGDGGTNGGGNDIIDFGASIVANSEIRGGSGNDRIGRAQFVNLSNSTLNGNAGNDLIDVDSASASFILGGLDSDTIIVGATAANTSFDNSVINGNKGADSITIGGALNFKTSSSTIFGGQGDDVIDASLLEDSIFLSGDLGNDSVIGGEKSDTVVGGDGLDTINGGLSSDLLTGGAGADLFNYTDLANSTINGNTGFDIITDFSSGDLFKVAVAKIVNTTTQVLSSAIAPDLQGLLGTVDLAANGVSLVSVTAGISNAGIAGKYLLIGDGTAGYQAATDTVIGINTLSGIGNDQFIV